VPPRPPRPAHRQHPAEPRAGGAPGLPGYWDGRGTRSEAQCEPLRFGFLAAGAGNGAPGRDLRGGLWVGE